MARKRMVDPHIWESFSFSELSDLAKILFISLISHADDEGRGIAGAAYIKNITFPHDETRRVAEVQKALSEIALHTSTQFYQVDGREYYCLLNWTDYQKVDKPSKSKLPPPPSVGEGGAILSRQSFSEGSGNIRGMFGEGSGNKDNRIEVNINNTHTARTREGELSQSEEEDLKELPSLNSKEFQEQFNTFTRRWDIVVDSCSPLLRDFDFDKLNQAYERSGKFLQCYPTYKCLSWIVKNYASIIVGKYDDHEKPEREGSRERQKPKYTSSYDPDAIPWPEGAIHVIRGGDDECEET